MRLVIDLQGAQGDNRARGIGRYTRELALAMAASPRGHDLAILLNAALPTQPLRQALAQVLPAEAIHAWHSPGATAWETAPDRTRRRAAEAIRAEAVAALRPDILHVSSLFEGWNDDAITAWPSWRSRPPTIATGYDLIPLIRRADYLDSAWKAAGITPWYLRCLHELRLADGALAISESSRAEIIRHLGLPDDRVFAIMAGIGAEFRPPNLPPADRAALLHRLALREGFVLFLGGGDIRKNESGLIRAWSLLPPALRARHQLVIVRRGDPAPLHAEARQAGLAASDLHLIDFVADADLPGLYAACALFVLPSLHEGFGLPAAEAMACGAPALASNATSLPEVIGRADALFDPHDPAAIAARIRAVLEDPALHADLAAHAPRQAARFNWPDVAARAWDALEVLHARHAATPWAPGWTSPGWTSPGWTSPWRPRLACVTPLPPQPSGIADYAAELLPELARHYDITLVAEVEQTTAEHLAHSFPVIAPQHFLDTAEAFDRVLYQVGNSPFHATAIQDLLPRIGGVVTLHDSFLSNATSWIAANRDQERNAFTQALYRAHGWPAVLHERREGHLAALRDYPISLRVLQDAIGVIQHSTHARDLLAAHYGTAIAAPIRVIPHPRRSFMADRAAARSRLGIPADQLLVASFGYVAPTKLPELLAGAFRHAALANARLVFVGPGDTTSDAILATCAAILGVPPATIATGHVDTPAYRDWLAATDIAVQLRTGSRGETSGAMLDAMASATALVANAHGAAAELPPTAVRLLPEHPSEADLAAALRDLADPATRATLAQAALDHLARHHASHAVALAYRDAIEAAYATGPAARRHWATQSLAQAIPGLDSQAALLTDCARAVAATFPVPGPPTLLIDIDAVPDLPPPTAATIAALLSDHPADQRVDLVAWRNPWHHARTRAAALLRLTSPAPDAPADLAGTTLLVVVPPDGACPPVPDRLDPAATRIALLLTSPRLAREPWMAGTVAHILPADTDAATILATLLGPPNDVRRAAG